MKHFGWKLFVATGLSWSALSAQATPVCSSQGLAALKQVISAQNSVDGIAVAPAAAYNGLTVSQITAQAVTKQGEAIYNQMLAIRLAQVVQAFIDGGGDDAAAATAMFGDTNRRQVVEIYKHGTNGAPSSTDAKCGSGSCQDIALEVSTIHVIPGQRAQTVMDHVSARKLSTINVGTVAFCEMGDGCTTKDQLVAGRGKVQQTETPSPMRIGVAYAAREIAKSPIGTVDNTSIYKITPLQICGHDAFVMSGVSTRDANSFTNASSDTVVVEAGSRVLSITVAQGVALKGSSVQGIFLHPFFAGAARKTLFTGYNESAVRLGTNEHIDNDGFLQR